MEKNRKMSLVLMYITNIPQVALIAEKNGVDRIWIDLEALGKEERQKGMNTVKSKHSIEDIKKIKSVLSKSDLMVRINPWNENSRKEIDSVINAGADIIMLPMWKTKEEVESFIQYVDGRVKTNLLLETKEAAECLDEVLKVDGIDEIHIGLNDLHLSYGLTFMFELLSNGTVESLCNKIKKCNIPYGFGGIAKIGEGMLPAEEVILEHYRLGSTRAILSRSFCNTDEIESIEKIEEVFSKNMKVLREYESHINECDIECFSKNKQNVKKMVQMIVDKKREDKWS